MAKVRYFIVPQQQRWTIRCAHRRIGAFGDPVQATGAALEVVSIGEVRGQAIEILRQDADGRWLAVNPRAPLEAPIIVPLG